MCILCPLYINIFMFIYAVAVNVEIDELAIGKMFFAVMIIGKTAKLLS